MTPHRVTRVDLHWWLTLASKLQWIFARTYADTAPHSYVVEGRTSGMSHPDYVRAARVIHTFGQPGKFYKMTSVYLASPDGGLKWWTMDADVTRTNLINQASTDLVYGVQNAPVTASGVETPFDAIASDFDRSHPTSGRLAAALRDAFASLQREQPPAVLDVGCGTGRVLDLQLTTPDRYAGVDPSSPMLNQLVRKHPAVDAVYPMRVERAVAEGLFGPDQFEIVTALMGEADPLDEITVRALIRIASRGVVIGRGEEVSLIRAHDPR